MNGYLWDAMIDSRAPRRGKLRQVLRGDASQADDAPDWYLVYRAMVRTVNGAIEKVVTFAI